MRFKHGYRYPGHINTKELQMEEEHANCDAKDY
jgi:hypothetical protein